MTQTAVKALLESDGKYLILKRSEKDEYKPTTPDLPGGRVREGESIEEAITRELKEETGLDTDIVDKLYEESVNLGPETVRFEFFLCKRTAGKLTMSSEHDSFEWMTKNRIKSQCPRWISRLLE